MIDLYVQQKLIIVEGYYAVLEGFIDSQGCTDSCRNKVIIQQEYLRLIRLYNV
jgi:hypothetical protein